MIFARVVSSPTLVALKRKYPLRLIVAPVTRSPGPFSTGRDSPVMADSSTEQSRGTRFFSRSLGEAVSVSRRQSMVNSGHVKLNVVRQCILLKVARSSLYYKRAGESAINLTVMQEIDRAFTEWPFLGVRQMRRYMVSLGYNVGRKRVSAV